QHVAIAPLYNTPTSSPVLYTLSLHDALPIWAGGLLSPGSPAVVPPVDVGVDSLRIHHHGCDLSARGRDPRRELTPQVPHLDRIVTRLRRPVGVAQLQHQWQEHLARLDR